MSIMTPEEFDALTREDFLVFIERVFAYLNPGVRFVPSFHIVMMAHALERVRLGECRRLIINVPPRSLKSQIASVAFFAWLHGHDPTLKLQSISYGQELAEDLARQTRQVLQSEWYQRLFPGTRIDPSRSAVHALETTAGGVRRATSMNGAITGFGAKFVVIDDPTKPEEAYSDTEREKANRIFRQTLFSRQNDKTTDAIVIVMQRLHENDLVGLALELDDWELVSFAAIAQADEEHLVVTPHGSYVHRRREGEALHPDREPLSELLKLQRVMGVEHFAAQYLQTPTPPGGGLVKLEWLRRYWLDDLPVRFDQVVNSWDTAQKAQSRNDPSVCTTWGIKDGNIYLLDVLRLRVEYPELKRAIFAQARRHRATIVLIEDKGSGISLLQDIRRDGMSIAKGVVPKADKVMRLRAQTTVIENGIVYIPESAPWLDDYLRELMTFPRAKHDDQVDSTTQFLEWFNWQPPEPNLIRYYREEAERMRDGSPEENRIVTLRAPPPVGMIQNFDMEGNDLARDPDGLFRLSFKYAKLYFNEIGWQIVGGL